MRQLCTACILAVLLGTSTARGQEASGSDMTPGFSVDLSLTVPSSYVFRGYVIQDNRFIVQPEATVTFDAMTIGGFEVTPYVGAWANFTDVQAPGDPNCWDELDLYVGADIGLGQGFTLGAIYTYYMSPGNSFDDIHEIGLTLTHDDVLNPWVGIYYEICNQNGEENTYIEVGIKPGCDIPNVDNLRIDFPIIAGFSPDDYYGDDCIGYITAGVHATYAITESCSVMAGLEYWNLHADAAQASNGGSENQCVALVGVSFSI